MFDILSITAGLKCALRFLTFLIKMRPAVFIVFCTLIKAPPENSKQNYDIFLRKSSEKQEPVNMCERNINVLL